MCPFVAFDTKLSTKFCSSSIVMYEFLLPPFPGVSIEVLPNRLYSEIVLCTSDSDTAKWLAISLAFLG